MTDIKELIRPGIIVIDKPRGPTSHQVAAWVRDILGLPVGHAGTLDPGVSGVLVMMLGPSVRLAPFLLKSEKEYICLLRLHRDVDPAKIREITGKFTGRIYQRPPKKSAVSRSLRIRTIAEIEVLEIAGRDVLLRVRCDAGTYIRSLCHHIGLALGTGAHMQELRRIRSGVFSEQDAHSLWELRDAAAAAMEGNDIPLRSFVHSPEVVLAGIPSVTIRDTAVDALCHGAHLAGVGITGMTTFRKGDQVAVFTHRQELVCLGEALVDSSSFSPGKPGLVLVPRVVLMRPGTYERGWRHRRERQVQVPACGEIPLKKRGG